MGPYFLYASHIAHSHIMISFLLKYSLLRVYPNHGVELRMMLEKGNSKQSILRFYDVQVKKPAATKRTFLRNGGR